MDALSFDSILCSNIKDCIQTNGRNVKLTNDRKSAIDGFEDEHGLINLQTASILLRLLFERPQLVQTTY